MKHMAIKNPTTIHINTLKLIIRKKNKHSNNIFTDRHKVTINWEGNNGGQPTNITGLALKALHSFLV